MPRWPCGGIAEARSILLAAASLAQAEGSRVWRMEPKQSHGAGALKWKSAVPLSAASCMVGLVAALPHQHPAPSWLPGGKASTAIALWVAFEVRLGVAGDGCPASLTDVGAPAQARGLKQNRVATRLCGPARRICGAASGQRTRDMPPQGEAASSRFMSWRPPMHAT